MTGDYFSVDALSATAIKAGRKSMKHMHHVRTTPSESSEALRWGTLAHAAILEPDYPFQVCPESHVMADKKGNEKEVKTTKRHAFWHSFVERHGERFAVMPDEMAKLKEMTNAVYSDPWACDIVRNIEATEIPVYWEDDEIGPCKCKLDAYSRTHGVLEVKTAKDVNERKFATQSEYLGYPLQFAWYYHGARQVPEFTNKRFHVITIEKSRPWDVVCYEVEPQVLAEAYQEALEIGRRYRKAQQFGSFSGMATGVMLYRRPDWATTNNESWEIGK